MALLGILCLGAGWVGHRRYRTLFNPLTVTMLVDLGLGTLISGVIAVAALPDVRYDAADVEHAAILSAIYAAGSLVPYAWRGSWLATGMGWVLRRIGLSSRRFATRFYRGRFWLALGLAGASLACVAGFGGGGMLWIRDSRAAYIKYRAGVGVFYLASHAMLTFAWIYYLWSVKPALCRRIVIGCLFVVAASVTGSKGQMLVVVLIGVVEYNFRVHRLSAWRSMLAGAAIALGVLGALVYQGKVGAGVLAYFGEPYGVTATFLHRWEEFGLLYGQGSLSEFWYYVPRAIFPAKPYEYGGMLINRILFPGAAEGGNTPGILLWTRSYLDFGAVGVLFAALARQAMRRGIFEYYLKEPKEYFAFVLMIQLALWPILAAPLGMVVLWCWSQKVILFGGPARRST